MNIKSAKLYVENFKRRIQEDQEEMNMIQQDLIDITNSVIRDLKNGTDYSEEEILDVIKNDKLYSYAVENDLDYSMVKKLWYDLVNRNLTDIIVNSEEEDNEEETIIDKYLTKSDKRKLESAIIKKFNSLKEEELSMTSHGSDKIPDEIKNVVLRDVNKIVKDLWPIGHDNIEELYSQLSKYVEMYMIRNTDTNRDALVELISRHLDEKLDIEDTEEEKEEMQKNESVYMKYASYYAE